MQSITPFRDTVYFVLLYFFVGGYGSLTLVGKEIVRGILLVILVLLLVSEVGQVNWNTEYLRFVVLRRFGKVYGVDSLGNQPPSLSAFQKSPH